MEDTFAEKVVANQPYYTLPSGQRFPYIGLGTALIKESKPIAEAIIHAGYRHIDTASYYQNEVYVGEAVKIAIEAGVKREDIFITSKLWITDF